MKKALILILIIFPFLTFSQKISKNREIIKTTIDKIQVIIIKDYINKQNNSIYKIHSSKINTSKDVENFTIKWYSKRHITYRTWENLNYLYSKNCYTNDTINVNNFLKDKFMTYVDHKKYGYNKNKIYTIIDNATKNIKSLSVEIAVKENDVLEESDINKKKKIEDNASITKKEKTTNLEEKNKTLIQDVKTILYLLISLITIAVLSILFFTINKYLKKMKKKKRKQEKKKRLKSSNLSNNNSLISKNIDNQSVSNIIEPFDDNKIQTELNTVSDKKVEQKTETEWLLVYTSETGKSHLVANPQIPCQDNHSVLEMENGWGIAISCDGAGSAKLSHHGSDFIAKQSSKLFKDIIIQNKWISKNKLPKQSDWELLCNKAMRKLRYDLDQLAIQKKIPVTDLACTIIVIVYSPIVLRSTHIGDGRAGFRDVNNNWEAIISPHKGEEANQTIFITSDPWLSDDFIMSGVKVPESRVINKKPTAFTVMSDGFESHSFETGYFDKKNQKFIEQNKPYTNFFEQIIPTIKGMFSEGKNKTDILKSWSDYVKKGTEKINNEPDDKTIIIGVLKD